jgi:hypothetical protein
MFGFRVGRLAGERRDGEFRDGERGPVPVESSVFFSDTDIDHHLYGFAYSWHHGGGSQVLIRSIQQGDPGWRLAARHLREEGSRDGLAG